MRRKMVERDSTEISVRHQCRVLSLARSGLYYTRRKMPESDLELMLKIDRLYSGVPYAGYPGHGRSAQAPVRRPGEPQAVKTTICPDGYPGHLPPAEYVQA